MLLSIMIFRITILSIISLSIMTFSITILSIMPLSKVILSIMDRNATLRINDTHHNVSFVLLWCPGWIYD